MKNFMILGASETQIPFIKIAQNYGYKVIITDVNKNAPGFKYADVVLNIDAADKEKVMFYAKKFNIEGIITKTEGLLYTVAYVNEQLNLIGISSKAAKVSVDKYYLRECMNKAGINSINSWKIKSLAGFENIKNKLIYPVVIKPIDAAGSRGVIKINSEKEFKSKFNYCKDYSENGNVIIEEFVEGLDCSAEFVTQNGKTHLVMVAEKITNGDPYFVETQHFMPANYSKDVLSSIEDICSRTLSIADVTDAVSFFDLKITKNGPVVIEMAARFAGDHICTDLIKLATGIDMYENLINITLGRGINIENKLNKYSVIKFITKFNYNKIIKNQQILEEDVSYIKHEFYKNKDNVCGLSNSYDRLGYYIFSGNNRYDLLKILKLMD